MEDPIFGAHHVIEVDGTSLHHWVRPGRPEETVVLSHGAAMDHRTWAPQMDALGDRQIVTWDASGHGRSKPLARNFSVRGEAHHLLRLLDDRGVDRALFVGQSMGGMIAQEVLREQPHRVAGLAIVGASSTTLPLTVAERILAPLTGPMLRLVPGDRLQRLIAERSASTAGAQAYALDAATQLTRAEFMQVWPELIAGVRPDPDYRIDVPVLLVRGEHDSLGNIARQMPLWVERDPDVRYVEVRGAGHLANMDAPRDVNTELRGFADRVFATP